jgi:hypothetical protein
MRDTIIAGHMGTTPRPPLGVMPREAWDALKRQERIEALWGAMERYAEFGKPVPLEWVRELREIGGAK